MVYKLKVLDQKTILLTLKYKIMTLVRFNNRPVVKRDNDFFNFSNMFNDIFLNDNQESVFNSRPPVNIVENSDDIRLMIAIPGYEKSDFSINIDDHVLTISLEPEDNTKSTDNFLVNEFNYTGFSRKFRIGDSINTDRIKASYNKGILEIILEKKEEEKVKPSRQIEIK